MALHEQRLQQGYQSFESISNGHVFFFDVTLLIIANQFNISIAYDKNIVLNVGFFDLQP